MKLKWIKATSNKLMYPNNTRGIEKSDIDYNKLEEILNQNNNTILVDVRSQQEYKEKYLKNAINIPLHELEKTVENIIQDKDTLIILYCKYGGRSLKAMKILEKIGYKNILNLKGGIDSI